MGSASVPQCGAWGAAVATTTPADGTWVGCAEQPRDAVRSQQSFKFTLCQGATPGLRCAGGWDEVAVGAREASLFLFFKNETVMLSSLVRTPREQGLKEPRRQERKLGGGSV